MAKPTDYSYIGRLPCGCVVAARVDCGDDATARDVADFIREGLAIERVSHQYVRENLTFNCPHKARQLALDMPDSKGKE